jgi:hypothetical protein
MSFADAIRDFKTRFAAASVKTITGLQSKLSSTSDAHLRAALTQFLEKLPSVAPDADAQLAFLEVLAVAGQFMSNFGGARNSEKYMIIAVEMSISVSTANKWWAFLNSTVTGAKTVKSEAVAKYSKGAAIAAMIMLAGMASNGTTAALASSVSMASADYQPILCGVGLSSPTDEVMALFQVNPEQVAHAAAMKAAMIAKANSRPAKKPSSRVY